MEAEFDRAERRREKERKEAERIRKQREEQDAKGRRIMEDAEKKRLAVIQAQREKDIKRREREEEEALSAGGVRFAAFLKPLPLANLETDRVRLPPSTLQKLLDEGAIDRTSGNVLTFELALFEEKTESIISKTHCGVLEFTAEEGTVEIPIKAVMSLCKEKGEAALFNWKLRVRYVAIDRFEKIRAVVQPLGKGFHVDGSETANIDLKTVLERVLSQQTTITQGDWIPVRHEGRTYTLAVRELSPDTQAVLINTDVEIDLMPSEDVTAEKERLERLERERQQRLQRAKQLAESLPSEPTAGGIAIRARLPESIVGSRKFDAETKLAVVFQWAESLMGDKAPPKEGTELEIVQSFLPGQSTVIDQSKKDKTLREVGFGRTENLNFRWKVTEANAMEVEETKTPEQILSRPTSSSSAEEWATSRTSAEAHLDRDLSQQQADQTATSTPMDEATSAPPDEISSADMFRLLVSKGAEPTSAAKVCQRFLPTLRTLKSLGLLEAPRSGSVAVELCDKFKGSTGRIADAMIARLAEETEAPQVEESTKWNSEIAILESMFTGRNREELLNALIKHGGSVQKAANELLS